MFPLRDENPAASFPIVTLALIAANVAVFAYEVVAGPELRSLLMTWGLVPQRLVLAIADHRDLAYPAATLFTSMFLHGGWLHLAGNLWYLWIFGDNIEDRIGHARYLVFYLLGGLAAAVVHVAFNADSAVPTVGASGAIAAVLGAYAMLYPGARVVTLVPLFFFIRIVSLPAIVVLGLWFVLQFFSGAMAVSASVKSGVAFSAHVGGFVFGLIAVRLFALGLPPRPRSG